MRRNNAIKFCFFKKIFSQPGVIAYLLSQFMFDLRHIKGNDGRIRACENTHGKKNTSALVTFNKKSCPIGENGLENMTIMSSSGYVSFPAEDVSLFSC